KKHQRVVLEGSNGEEIDFKYANDRGDSMTRRHSFEGILPNMERRYRETESSAVREDLARFLSSQTCPDCEGTRLCPDARHVYINGITLPEITEMTIAQAAEYFANLKLDGARATIAEKIIRELEQRLQFLIDVGLNYLTLSRSAD